MNQLIIVIDDSIVTRRIVEVGLRRTGYREVRCFADGRAAIQWLNGPEGQIPALIVIDWMMPKLDGIQLLQYFKGKPAYASTILVMLSGRDGLLNQLKGRLAGAHVYLTKPFKRQDIVAVVQQYLGEAQENDRTGTYR
jgi:twitching motility two-component system response regulator PilG